MLSPILGPCSMIDLDSTVSLPAPIERDDGEKAINLGRKRYFILLDVCGHNRQPFLGTQ